MNDLRTREVTFLEPAFMTFDLAMLMKKSQKPADIEKLSDLDRNINYTYGVVAGGATSNYLNSEYPVTWSKVSGNDQPANIEEGESDRRKFAVHTITMVYSVPRLP